MYVTPAGRPPMRLQGMRTMSESKTATKAVQNSPPPPAPAQAKPSGPIESKSSRFRRLAVKRTARALKTIGYVANLSSTASYEYTPEQAAKIVAGGLEFDG